MPVIARIRAIDARWNPIVSGMCLMDANSSSFMDYQPVLISPEWESFFCIPTFLLTATKHTQKASLISFECIATKIWKDLTDCALLYVNYCVFFSHSHRRIKERNRGEACKHPKAIAFI